MEAWTPPPDGELKPGSKEILDGLKKKWGRVPNIYAAMAHSPAALKSLLQFRDTLGQGRLSPQEIEAIALIISQETSCAYCLAAHTRIARAHGLSDQEILLLRKAGSTDGKLRALTLLAREILLHQGEVRDGTVRDFYAAGYDKEVLAELTAQVALNLFTCYFNKAAGTPLDYPEAPDVQ